MHGGGLGIPLTLFSTIGAGCRLAAQRGGHGGGAVVAETSRRRWRDPDLAGSARRGGFPAGPASPRGEEPHGLTARIIDETNSMSDVYTAFYEFSSLLESKIDDNDPNAVLTRKRVNSIKETCKSSCLLKRRGYDLDIPKRDSAMIMMVILLLVAVVWGVLYGK